MSDREARVLGAGEPLKVGGKEYYLSPVHQGRLVEMEREALRYCQRKYLECFRDNAELLPESQRSDVLLRKHDEVARWDMDDLPAKTAYDVSQVPITDKLVSWLKQTYGELPEGELGLRFLLAAALDAKQIKPDEVAELTGRPPQSGFVRYDLWWVSATHEGMLLYAWASVQERHPEISKQDVASWPHAKIVEASRIAEALTRPNLGNT